MPAAVLQTTPMKRALMESTNARRNIQPSPQSAKRRKLDGSLKTPTKALNGLNSGFGSSQPKSQFEETLEKLTQDINGLKQKNSEKDQQWARPSLGDFDAKNDSLCFQQIDAEESTLHGGKTTVKLFGITEARNHRSSRSPVQLLTTYF